MRCRRLSDGWRRRRKDAAGGVRRIGLVGLFRWLAVEQESGQTSFAAASGGWECFICLLDIHVCGAPGTKARASKGTCLRGVVAAPGPLLLLWLRLWMDLVVRVPTELYSTLLYFDQAPGPPSFDEVSYGHVFRCVEIRWARVMVFWRIVRYLPPRGLELVS